MYSKYNLKNILVRKLQNRMYITQFLKLERNIIFTCMFILLNYSVVDEKVVNILIFQGGVLRRTPEEN